MSTKFKYSKFEQELNNVLKYQSNRLSRIKDKNQTNIDETIRSSEELLTRLGYSSEFPLASNVNNEIKYVIPSWDKLVEISQKEVGDLTTLESLFTEEELILNLEYLKNLNNQYKEIHRLDKSDFALSIFAGIVGSIVDILLIGVPKKSKSGLKSGPLSNVVRDYFDKIYPKSEMEILANSKIAKVPFDAQDNRNTTVYVEGLSAYYHRLLQLGHDPILGLIFGTFDILNGTMTTIDKKGVYVVQVIENYKDRQASDVFEAICKLLLHLKSDITTSMGLPAPLMGLFNLLQIGSFGDEEQTVAEIVQGMYYEGYDFIHFISQSIPVMLIEVIIRLGYTFKRIKQGHSVKEAIPFSKNRADNPKLGTMLFMGHSTSAAINAGKIYFTKKPLTINYPLWLMFLKYSYQQVKWLLLDKEVLRHEYIVSNIEKNLDVVFNTINNQFDENTKGSKLIVL